MDVIIKPSSDFTKLVCQSRDQNLVAELRMEMRKNYPGLVWSSVPNGLKLNPFDVARLIPFDIPNIHFDLDTEARRIIENRKYVIENNSKIKSELQRIREGGTELSKSELKEYPSLNVLDDHQWVNVAAMTLSTGFGLALFDEQGAGKTVSAIFTYDVLVERDKVDFCLIVSPKSMIQEWKSDFYKFRGNLYLIKTLIGSRSEKT